MPTPRLKPPGASSALVAAAMIRLDGGDPTLADGFNAAKARLPSILGYAAIVTLVGPLLVWAALVLPGW